jgi:voltage-gated sodium channel
MSRRRVEWPVFSRQESESMRTEFETINTDKNSVISRDELITVWRKTFPDLSEAKLTKMVDDVIAVADLDGDGTINFDEFMNLCTMDTGLRFDVSFVRHQHKKAADQLGLAFYIPFIVLFVYFLMTGKAIGTGFSLHTAVMNNVAGNEFGKTSALDAKYFADITSVDQIWQWLNGPVMDSFWPSDGTATARGSVFGQSQLIGALKIRQVRIERITCGEGVGTFLDWRKGTLDSNFYNARRAEFIPRDQCFPDQVVSDGRFAHETSYTRLNETTLNAPASPWVFRSCEDLNGSTTVLGRHSRYPCFGNAIIIPIDNTRDQATATLKELANGILNKDGETVRWIDSDTRLVALEFVIYNKNIRFFAFSQFLVEMTAGGAIFPSHNVVVFQPFLWSDRNPAHWVFFFVFFLYVLGYIVHFILSIHNRIINRMADKHRTGFIRYITTGCSIYMKDPWCPFDCLNLSIFVAVFVLRFTWMSLGLAGNSPLQVSYYPSSFEDMTWLFHTLTILDSMNALLCFIRIFYFVRLNEKLNVLTMTVEKALPSLIGIIVVFFVVFTGFALMASVAFGHVSENFKDWDASVSTLSRMLVGDFDYEALRSERRTFTGIFFVLYIVIAVFLLLNMIIAVLSSAFEEVESEKYDFAPILRVMSLVKSELKVKNWVMDFMENPMIQEFKYWFTIVYLEAKRAAKDMPEEDYIKLRGEAEDKCPRKYWSKIERELLNRSITIDFKSQLRMTPISLNEKLRRTFGRDINQLKEKLIHPTAKHTGISERSLLLDMVEYHHHWETDAKMYCDLPEDDDYEETPLPSPKIVPSLAMTALVNASGVSIEGGLSPKKSPSPRRTSAGGRRPSELRDDLHRRVDALARAVETMPDLIVERVLQALNKKEGGGDKSTITVTNDPYVPTE